MFDVKECKNLDLALDCRSNPRPIYLCTEVFDGSSICGIPGYLFG